MVSSVIIIGRHFLQFETAPLIIFQTLKEDNETLCVEYGSLNTLARHMFSSHFQIKILNTICNIYGTRNTEKEYMKN